MLFLTSSAEIALTELVDDTECANVAVICELDRLEQVMLLTKLFAHEFFTRLAFHGSLAGCRLMSPFSSWLSRLTRLTRLEVTDAPGMGLEQLAAFFRAVGRSRIRNLNVSRLGLGSEGAQLLCEAVEKNLSMKILRADGNMMRTGTALVLGLDLHTVSVGDNDVHRKWWPTVMDNTSVAIKRLGLGDCRLDSMGLEAVAGFLLRSQLVELDVGGNMLCRERFKILCTSLVGHKTLMTLKLGGCELTNGCMRDLGSLLAVNYSLQQLYMHNNPEITKKGQLKLIGGMQRNWTVRYLEIDCLFESDCTEVVASRIALDPKETLTGHLGRLVCANQDLDLLNQFWRPNLNLFYPPKMQERVAVVFFLLRQVLPLELVVHILSFWKGIQFD